MTNINLLRAAALFAVVAAPTLLCAQVLGFDAAAFGSTLSIDLSPAYPGPGQVVHLTARARGFDISQSAVLWHADQKVIAQGVGRDTAQVVAPALGHEMQIDVEVAPPGNASILSAQAIIVPTMLDLLVGSDSYTPPFYRGRALPAAGTDLIVEAVPHFKRGDGSLIPDSAITFTWKQGLQTLLGSSGVGRSSLVIPIMHLHGNDPVTVSAVSQDGTRGSEATIAIPVVPSVLDLYEDHPLYGILYNNALPQGKSAATLVPDTEMTFATVPYFAAAGSGTDTSLSYAWQVNGQQIPSSPSAPNEITVNALGSTGQAQMTIEVTHASNYLMDATGQWNVVFSTAAAQKNPFGTVQ